MWYIDTSVLAAFYLPEKKSGKVARFLSEIDGAAISPLVEIEFMSAVSRRVRMREVSADDGKRIVSQFRLHSRSRLYRIVAITQRENDLAAGWLADLGTPLRALDALHLAVVFSNKLDLVTADTVLAASARKLGVTVKTV